MDHNLNVLLVDDDPTVSMCIMRQLEHLGCVHRVTPSHVQALEVLERDKLINTVLLDHGTTNGRVADFISAAQSIRAGIKIIGCSSSDCGPEFAAAGVPQFLRKPPELSDLEEMLGLCESSSQDAASTKTGKFDSDTLGFAVGESVRIVVGSMEGLEGTCVSVRAGGKILVELQKGLYLEIQQDCVDSGAV